MEKPAKNFATLTRLNRHTDEQSAAPLRHDSVNGWFDVFPAPGESLYFFGPPVDPAMWRRSIITSPITEIRFSGGRSWTLVTRNSTYLLELTDGPADDSVAKAAGYE